MKLKKLLASILCVAMVLSTMGITTFAEGEVETISVSTAENLATALTKNEANIAVILEDNIDLPITSLGSITAGSGEYKLGGENTQEITIDLNQKTLNVTTTYWSALGSVNPDATITVKNGTMVSTGNSATTWNANDLRFCNCNWVFEDVTFNKEVALDNAGKLTTMNDVTINGTGDYYALWITAEGQTVNIDGLVINTEGRGIKIDEQYVDAENTVQVALAVSNSTFKTAKKAAIVVKSVAGADIVASNNNIENVNADTTNLVCVDSDLPASYPKVKVTIDGEPVAPYLEDAGTGVACIGNSYYMTLTNALDAAQGGDIVDLLGGTIVLKDTGVTTVPINKNITITNGTFDITGFVAAHINSIFDIYGGAEVTFEDVDFTGSNYSSSYGVIYAHETSKVTLKNCDFNLENEIDAVTGAVLKGNDYANDKFVVNNCDFTLSDTSRVFALMTIDMNGGSINATHEPISEEHAFRDVYGTIDDATISFDNFQNGIKNTKNAALTFTNSTVSSTNMAEYDLQLAGGATVSGVAFDKTNCKAVVSPAITTFANGTTYYATLEEALADAKDGDTISLIYNEGDAPIAMNGYVSGKTVTITGTAVVDWSKGSLFVGRGGEGNGKLIFDNANLTSTEASLKNGTYGIHVSMEEYGASNKADGEVVFKNSNIDLSYLMNKNNVTVDGGNLTVWNGFAVGARPASETNNVQRAAELKLSNNAVVEVKNHNGMGIGYESNGIANIDAGSTLKISAASLAVAANSTVNSKGNIIGLLDVADGATMNFTDGFYTEDPSAYCAEGYEVDKSEVEGYAYTVVPKAAQKINVVFENGKNEGEYILKLKSADEKEIYKFVSAELTFKNNSESLGDAIGTLPFEFVENTNIDVEKSLEDANTYAFALKNPANRITATEIELGTIKFTSQGTPALAVTAGTVVATRYNTNLPKYYSTDAELNGEGLTLDISATLDGTPVPDTTRDVAVKIEYNLGLVGGVWADDEIEVTLVDKFGDEVTATKVSNGLFTFEDVATGRIEVKLSAPGFRTYTYDAILYETEEENNPLVLNFWNNVKTGKDEDPLKKIDDSNAIEKEMPHNFVVGDIVMDFIVDRYDLAAVTSYYGMYNITERTNASEKYLKYDLNRDGNIDIIDVHYVLHTFGN